MSPCFDIRNFAHQQFGCCLPAGTPSQRRRARCPVVGKMARQLLFCCLSAAINQPPTLLELLADDLRLGLCRNAARSPFSCLLNGPPSGCWPWNPLFAPPFSLSESGVPKSSWRSLIPEAKIPPCSIEHVARIGVESTIVGRNLLPITLSRC